MNRTDRLGGVFSRPNGFASSSSAATPEPDYWSYRVTGPTAALVLSLRVPSSSTAPSPLRTTTAEFTSLAAARERQLSALLAVDAVSREYSFSFVLSIR